MCGCVKKTVKMSRKLLKMNMDGMVFICYLNVYYNMLLCPFQMRKTETDSFGFVKKKEGKVF